MQYGPETSTTPPKATSQPAAGSESATEPAVEQAEGSESFFQTWSKGQDMPMGPSLLFMAGVLLAMIIIMRSLMRSSARRKQQTRTMGQPSERIEHINDRARGTMEPARQAMVEAEDLTRRMGAVLDNKATKIEVLLAEATERIAELERASRADHGPANPAPSPRSETGGICPETLDRARLDQDRVERDLSNDHTYKFDPKTTSSASRESALPESPNPMTFAEQVEELLTKGLDAKAIAQELGCPIGEVELVLNLRRNSG